MEPGTTLAVVVWAITGLYLAVKLLKSVQMVPNKTELIVERLGRYHETLGPGLHVLLPFFDHVAFRVDMKEEAIEVPPQDCFTKDNVKVEVDGIVYMSVINPKQASYGITNYRFAAIQLAQTTTRAVIGTLELDRTFEERDVINSRVVAALNEVSTAWGIKVHRYEVKNIVPPASVKNAMERQMGAERDRRALLARAEGEKQARINDSEGKKQEMINRSEGEMQRRVNEAEGKAEEILALAQATADSIRLTGEAISASGGSEAVNLRLSQAYIQKLGALSNGAQVVLPADLTRVSDLLKGVGLEPKSAELKTTELKSPEFKSPDLKSLEPKSLEPKSLEPKSLEPKSLDLQNLDLKTAVPKPSASPVPVPPPLPVAVRRDGDG